MKNKGTIITLGVVSAIAIAAYVVYTMMKGKTSAAGGVGTKKSTISTAKQTATIAQQAKSNPNDAAAQQAYTQLGLSLVNALLASNKSAKPSTTPKGVPCITVDNKGNYIEKDDASTLYNAQGNPIGDIDPSSGMFVNKQGEIIANSDGTPASVNQYGNVVESDGSTYTLDGTPIQQNNDGSYAELDSNGNILGTYTSNGDPITDTAASNTPVYDPTTDPDSLDYIGSSGYRSSFGKRTIHSLIR